MPVGFARSLFSGSSRVPKETILRINSFTSTQTGMFYHRTFSNLKDEMGILLGTVDQPNGGFAKSYSISDGTYNMKITASGSTAISMGSPGSYTGSATIGKGKWSGSNFNFSSSKVYSASSNNSTSVSFSNLNLPYDFGTVTFSGDSITVYAGVDQAGNGVTQTTPSWTITLYEIVS